MLQGATIGFSQFCTREVQSPHKTAEGGLSGYITCSADEKSSDSGTIDEERSREEIMYTISKMFTFEASHQLVGLPDNPDGSSHQCTRLHGHGYRVELLLCSPVLDEHGFVVDYGDLKPFADYIALHMDHRHLNDLVAQPTAENIAKHLYDVAWTMWHEVAITVRVSETQKTWATYEGV